MGFDQGSGTTGWAALSSPRLLLIYVTIITRSQYLCITSFSCGAALLFRGPTTPRFAPKQNQVKQDLGLPGFYFTFVVRLEPIGFSNFVLAFRVAKNVDKP